MAGGAKKLDSSHFFYHILSHVMKLLQVLVALSKSFNTRMTQETNEKRYVRTVCDLNQGCALSYFRMLIYYMFPFP